MNRTATGKVFPVSLLLCSVAPIIFGNAGTITATPTTVPFGNVVPPVPSSSKTVVIKNTGSVPVTINALSITGASSAQFNVTLSGFTLPKSLSASQTATINVAFMPGESNATYNATIVVTSTAATPTLSIPISGSGYNHQQLVTWSVPPVNPAIVAGYNLYRSVGCTGTFTNVNDLSTPITGTSYLDTNLPGGQEYCYMTTVVGAGTEAGKEGAYSNVAVAIIPLP